MAVQNLYQRIGGNNNALNLAASVVIKATPGTLWSFYVNVAGAAGKLYDCKAIGDAAAANEICVTPATVGNCVPVAFSFKKGLVYIPGAAQVASCGFA